MELSGIRSVRLCLGLFFVGVGLCGAQQEIPAPEASPTPKQKPAHIRIWSMVYDEKAPFSLRATSPEKEPVVLKESEGKLPEKANYEEIPSGKFGLSLSSAGKPVKSSEVELIPGGYSTVVIYRKNGSLTMEILADPNAGQRDFPPAVRLFNFGTERVAEVTLGANAPILVPPNSFIVTPVTQQEKISVGVKLADPAGGAPATSFTDVSTAQSPSWSIVTIPDYRGKLRPRVSPDGPE